MKTRKTRLWLFLLAFAMCFALTGKNTQAASFHPIYYVKSSDKALIMKVKEFCAKGYTYTITKGSDTTALMSGTLSGGTVGKDRMFKIKMGSKYSKKTQYTLTIVGKDKKKKVVARYYTGCSLNSASVKKKSDNSIKATCSLSSGYKCTGQILIYKGDDSTSLLASANFKKSSTSGSTTTMVAKIASSKLATGSYKTYAVMSYKINGLTYYGQGIAATFKYVKSQQKVTGVKVSTSGGKVKLTWNAAKDATYYNVYQKAGSDGSYKCIKSKVKKTSYKTYHLAGGKTYYYQIEAVGVAGSKTVKGEKSTAVHIEVPVVPAKVKGIKFALDMDEDLVVKWNKTENASGYIVYYKEASAKKYKKLKTTSNRVVSLESIRKSSKTYNVKVIAYKKSNGKKVLAEKFSDVITITPKTDIKKNRQKLLANGVRSVEYIGTTKVIWTSRKYSKERKLAFVNKGGYSSPNKYLIWISHYTQQVNIFKGKKGHWKLYKTFICSTGTALNHAPVSSTKTFKITYKEKGWYYTSTKELYVSHYESLNSFHTRPLYNDGSVCDPTIGKPCSHGCVRLYNEDAKFIYDKMPIGTTVISF